MKYTIIFLLLLSLSQLTVRAQAAADNSPVCTDKDVENFSSRGIKLGMNFKEIINSFVVNGKINTVNFNYSDNKGWEKVNGEYTIEHLNQLAQTSADKHFGSFFIGGVISKDSNRFEDISRYDFGFLDGKLSFIRITYEKPDWADTEQFIRTLSKVSNLPKAEYWKYNKVQCGTTKIQVGLLSEDVKKSQLEISKPFDEVIRARQKNFEEKERQKDIISFKP